MNDLSRTKPELLKKISALQARVRELERSETEHVRTEEELRSARQKLRLLIDAGPDFFFLKDLDLRYQLVNTANARFFGCPEAEILGKTDQELMPEGSAATCQGTDRLAIRMKKTVVTVEPVGDRFYETHKFPVIVAGHVVGVAGIVRDITNRRRTEESLRDVEARYRLLFEHAPYGIVIIDPATARFVEFNETAHRQLGYSREEFAGLSIPDVEVIESPEETMKRIEIVVREGKAEFETMHRTRQGEIRNVHVTAQMTGISGHSMYHCVWRDITEHKRAREALLESEIKYRTLVENSLAGVYIYQDGLFRFVNKRFSEIHGYTYEEIVDKLCPADFTHPDDRHIVGMQNRKFLEGESGDVSFTHRVTRKDGAIITVNVLASPTIYRGLPAVSGTVYDITEQERAEELLRQKTALLEAQVNASLDGILVVDKGKKILQNRQVNDLLKIPARIAGSDDDEAQIEWVKSVVKDPEKFHEKVAYMFAHPGETMRDELELKDGTVLDRYSGPVIGKDDRNYGRIWTFRDITERKRSEEALRAGRLQLSEAMDLAHMVYWEFDSMTETYVFNDPFYVFYGTTAEREGGYRMTRDEYALRFIHPDDLPRYFQFVEQNSLRPGPELVADIEHRIVRRDGEARHIVARSRIVKDNSGRIVKRYGSNQDITERKQMEKAVQESEEQFRKIFERSPLGMVTAGIDLRFKRANAAFCKMLGYRSEELVSLTFKDITHPEHKDEDGRHVGELVSGKIPLYRTEKRYIRKDGEVVWGSSTVTLMRDVDGRFLYSLTTVEDITQRKEAEEEKARLESQLRQAQKMEAVGTLAGGVAHDFNNVLTVITGYSALLKMEMGQNNPLQSYVEYISSSAEKAAFLTRSLLSFSRLQPVALTPIDMNESLRSVEKLLKRLLTEDIAIKTLLAPGEITVMADIAQIDQILFNLATNARDAMPEGGTFTMKTEIVELDDEFLRFHGYGEPGRYALLSISDTGVGIDEATREKIFDPFFTTKEAGKGTGLGLSTVYGIVKQHNGFVSVYSEPNMGTTFRIYLPTAGAVGTEERSAPAPVTGGNETILVAEDNEAVRDLMCRILKEYGYATVEACDGAEAVEQFKKTDTIDLLVLDSVMPVQNGRKAYDVILNMKPDIKVLFTSGYTRDVVLDKGIEDKKFDFISKPVSPNALLQKVREVLDGGDGR